MGSVLMLWFFGCEAWGILAPHPGIELAHPMLEDEVLSTESPGKSYTDFFFPPNGTLSSTKWSMGG